MTIQKSLGFLALLVLLPAVARGSDLTFSFGGYADYDSNVFRRESNVEDDYLFRLVPGVKLHEDRGQDLNYSLEYRVPMEFSVNFGDRLNDVDQWLDADALYHVNDRLDLYVGNDFRYLRSTLRTTQTLDSAQLPIISTERDRVTINNLNGGARYRFTPRVSGNLDVVYRLFNTTNDSRSDNFMVNGRADLSYALTSKQQVGAGLTYIFQQFDEVNSPTTSRVGSTSNTINAFARWVYQIGETIGIELSAGPSYIVVDQDDPLSFSVQTIPITRADPVNPSNVFVIDFASCRNLTLPDGASGTVFDQCTELAPSIPRNAIDNSTAPPTTQLTSLGTLGDTRSTNVNWFANAAITKRWTPNFTTSARYSRSQGNASGLGGTVIRNAVTAAADWKFADRWDLLLRGDWTLRKSVTETNEIVRVAEDGAVYGLPGVAAVEGSQFSAPLPNNTIDTRRWGVVGRLTYRLFRNTTTSAQLTYNDQNSNGSTLGAGSDFQGWIATLGFRHVFEPIKLW
jgi:hypothetical protein